MRMSMKEWLGEIRKMKVEMKEELEKIGKEMKVREEKWEREREELRRSIEREWEVIILIETWMEEKGWEEIKRRLPKGYIWGAQWAEKENRKGRAMGGMIMGIRKHLMEKGERIVTEKEELKSCVEEGELQRDTIIGRDFNARTGEEGGGMEEGDGREKGKKEGWRRERASKDKRINREGRKMIEFIEERGWGILNGCTKGDDEGKLTFTGGRGGSVIDYVIGSEEVREKVERLRVGKRVDSGHQPVEIWIRREGRRKSGEGVKWKRRQWRGIWDEKRKEEFKKKLGRISFGGRGVKEEGEEMEKRIKEALKEMEEEGKKEDKTRRGWWDRECEEKKRVVRKELGKWKRKERGGEEYRKEKKEYRELCERKKKEEGERWEKRARKVKKESEVWDLINKERKKNRRIEEEIKMKEWNEYFMRILGGVEGKVVMGERRRGEEEEKEEWEEEIGRKELKAAIGKLKVKKQRGRMRYRERYGNLEEKNWKNGFGNCVGRYGMGGDGQKDGRKGNTD
nr:PREDICTED: golgin subfamily A member 6-like protein 22 [Linepithema humile]